jgi:ribonuclease HI
LKIHKKEVQLSEKENPKPWKRMQFRKNKVWVACGEDGELLVENGKVLIKYQLDQDYEYRVHEKSVKPIGSSAAEQKDFDNRKTERKPTGIIKKPADKKTGAFDEEICRDSICIYTDGASSGNPGPSGIGVLLRFGKHEKEISKYIGIATNNIAELEAIRTGLLELKETRLPIRVFTDSSYAYGIFVLGWKPKKNIQLVESIRKLILKFNDLKFIKIKGHTGIEGNERADFLATSAIKTSEPKN